MVVLFLLVDLAQHYLSKNNISALRRVRKTDNNRIARACGATIVNRTDELREEDVGTGCGLFEVRKIGDEYFTFLVDCKDPKACSILLRGPSKDILNEVSSLSLLPSSIILICGYVHRKKCCLFLLCQMERNLQDAMQVVRNVMIDPRLVPGGGALEMALAQFLSEKSKVTSGLLCLSALETMCVCVCVECRWSATMALQSSWKSAGSNSSYFNPELWCKYHPSPHSA